MLSGTEFRHQVLSSDDFKRLTATVAREKMEGGKEETDATIRMADSLGRMMETDGWKIVEAILKRMIDLDGVFGEVDEDRRKQAILRGQVVRKILMGIYAHVEVGKNLKAAQEEQKAAKEG